MSNKNISINIMSILNTYEKIRNIRVEKGLTLRNVAGKLDIDVAILSKMERGERNLNKDILIKLSRIYNRDASELLVSFLSDKIVFDISSEDYADEILKVAEQKIANLYLPKKADIAKDLKKLLTDIDRLKLKLDSIRPIDSTQMKNLEEYFEISYTYDSNKIEGNTLTLQETALVVEKGMTISGKSLREHLEAINHYDAISYIKDIVKEKTLLSERVLKNIHLIVLRGIDDRNAGKYREIEVRISGSSHIPPEFFKLPDMMEKYFYFYDTNKKKLHPVILASDMHQRLVDIQPFTVGNGRTARLIMNLILLQNGMTIANISGDYKKRIEYYKALEKAQTEYNVADFRILIANEVKRSLKSYIDIVSKKR